MPLLIQPRPISRARAAARPCASSRCSRPASSRDTGRPQCPPPSGSTPHEPAQHHPPLQRRSVSLVQDQHRQRSSKRVSSPARKARIGVRFLLPGAPSLVATTVRLHNRSAGNLTKARIVNGYAEIPIERHSCAQLPAGSFPEGFRTTAPVLVDRFRCGRHPKPCTKGDGADLFGALLLRPQRRTQTILPTWS